MTYLPERFILRTGVGKSDHQLGAFDQALLRAGLGNYNLIKVSSVLPPSCSLQKEITLSEGALLPSAFALIYAVDIGTTISAAVAVGIPSDSSIAGVIMEHSALATRSETEKIVRVYAQKAMDARGIKIKEIVSASIEISVTSNEIHCAFATVSMW